MSTVLPNLHTTPDNLEAGSKVDLVIEAIVENMDVKKKLFPALDAVAPPYVHFPILSPSNGFWRQFWAEIQVIINFPGNFSNRESAKQTQINQIACSV